MCGECSITYSETSYCLLPGCYVLHCTFQKQTILGLSIKKPGNFSPYANKKILCKYFHLLRSNYQACCFYFIYFLFERQRKTNDILFQAFLQKCRCFFLLKPRNALQKWLFLTHDVLEKRSLDRQIFTSISGK